jgi:hypothetical protein
MHDAPRLRWNRLRNDDGLYLAQSLRLLADDRRTTR